MPLRPLNRQQTWLFPPTLDELLPEDHPVIVLLLFRRLSPPRDRPRFVAALVDGLDCLPRVGYQLPEWQR